MLALHGVTSQTLAPLGGGLGWLPAPPQMYTQNVATYSGWPARVLRAAPVYQLSFRGMGGEPWTWAPLLALAAQGTDTGPKRWPRRTRPDDSATLKQSWVQVPSLS